MYHQYQILRYDSASSKWINANTIIDALTFVKDDVDGTKMMKFELSAITANNTRTLTVPDATTIIVGTLYKL